MSDRPILFSGPMVRALLEGRKTQTRRVLRQQPPAWANFCQEIESYNVLHQWVRAGRWWWAEVNEARDRALRWWPLDDDGQRYAVRPPTATGDRLWVRETWSHTGDGVFEIRQARIAPTGRVIFAATPAPDAPHAKYWPSIHMPREFSRLTLVVTEVRVERLQDISEVDAKAEGVKPDVFDGPEGWEECTRTDHVSAFRRLWDGLNASRGYGWDANPWVVALTFAVHNRNIDRMPAEVIR